MSDGSQLPITQYRESDALLASRHTWVACTHIHIHKNIFKNTKHENFFQFTSLLREGQDFLDYHFASHRGCTVTWTVPNGGQDRKNLAVCSYTSPYPDSHHCSPHSWSLAVLCLQEHQRALLSPVDPQWTSLWCCPLWGVVDHWSPATRALEFHEPLLSPTLPHPASHPSENRTCTITW